ncbi:hypothetical protein PWT90_08361 [Aphanocladium album]|nr:hypothetical protein PWT90_08361 [Aphanocladium album]
MAARQAAPARRAGGSSPTHFLCIPLLRRQLACSMAAFKADVTSINAASPLPPSAVRPPGTMHITLGVMHLPTRAQVDAAVTLLRDLRLRDIISDARGSLSARAGGLAGGGGGGTPTEGSVWLTLRGLRAMQDPARTGVLYAPPLDADGQEAGLVPRRGRFCCTRRW